MRGLKKYFAVAFTAVILAGALPSAVSAETADGIEIPDATLKATIVDTLELSTDVVTENDMKKLTELETPVNDPAKKIKDLTGLEYAINLTSLNLDYNKITDLTPIAGLTKLKELDISYNDGTAEGTQGLTDISCLSGLVNLEKFYSVNNASVKDYSVVANFTKLKKLNLSICNLSDVGFVSELTSLEKLYLSFNNIYDITPLAKLTSLKTLALGTNRVIDIAPVANFEALTQLTLENNYIDDFTAILSLKNLTMLDVSRNFITDEQIAAVMENVQAEKVIVLPKADDSKKSELIVLNAVSKELKVGEEFTLTAARFDGSAIEGATFASSDTAVATVGADGKIKAVKEGACYITVTAPDGYARSCAVSVVKEETPERGGCNGCNSNVNAGGTLLGTLAVLAGAAVVFALRRKNVSK